jgi:hypothetical protein
MFLLRSACGWAESSLGLDLDPTALRHCFRVDTRRTLNELDPPGLGPSAFGRGRAPLSGHARVSPIPRWLSAALTVEPTTNDITHGLALYLIDRRGFERTGYLFPFLPNFLALDLETLARERV